MSRAEDALMRLYESASLRDELTDEEAKQLLKWAEDEVVRLDESGADDDAFEGRSRDADAPAQADESLRRTAGAVLRAGGGRDAAADRGAGDRNSVTGRMPPRSAPPVPAIRWARCRR